MGGIESLRSWVNWANQPGVKDTLKDSADVLHSLTAVSGLFGSSNRSFSLEKLAFRALFILNIMGNRSVSSYTLESTKLSAGRSNPLRHQLSYHLWQASLLISLVGLFNSLLIDDPNESKGLRNDSFRLLFIAGLSRPSLHLANRYFKNLIQHR